MSFECLTCGAVERCIHCRLIEKPAARRRQQPIKFVRYYARYGGRYSEIHDTFREALDAAFSGHEYGECYTISIETNDGWPVVDHTALFEFYHLLGKEQDRAEEARKTPQNSISSEAENILRRIVEWDSAQRRRHTLLAPSMLPIHLAQIARDALELLDDPAARADG